MRRTSLLTVAAVAFGLAGVPATARAAGTDTTYALPILELRDSLVDAAHGHLFLSGGPANVVLVRDVDGAPVATIADQPNAAGMALSPDGTRVYVALPEAAAISAIDTTTLAEVSRYPTGTACPVDLATHASAVWFSYRSCSGVYPYVGGDIGHLEVGGEMPVVTLSKLPEGATGIAGSPATLAVNPEGTRLVAGVDGSWPATLYSLEIIDATLAYGVSREVGTELADFAMTPDGTKVVTASRTPYQHQRLLVSDLSLDRTFGNFTYPAAVAANATHVAAGTNADTTTDIRIATADGARVREYRLNRRLVPRGVVFGPDGGTLYAVTTSYPAGAYKMSLHVFYDPAKLPSSLTLAKPSTAKINTTYAVTGTLSTGAAGKTLHVTRSSAYGTVTLPDVVTGSGGAFSVPDKVAKRGTYTYTVSFDGDATYARTTRAQAVYVTGHVPSLTIATNATTYGFHATAAMTARLGTTSTSRVVRLSVTPYGYSAAVLRQQNVDSGGYVRATYTVTRRTVFTAYFAGDDLYEPRAVSVARGVYASLGTSVSGYYATSGSYRLYRRTVDPVIGSYVQPNRMNSCTSYEAQRYTSGAWRTVATNSCIALDRYSRAKAYFVGDPTVATPYRLRATFNGDASNLRVTGQWWYLKFT